MRLGDGFKVCTFKQAQIGDAQRNQRPWVVQSDLGSATARPLNENQRSNPPRVVKFPSAVSSMSGMGTESQTHLKTGSIQKVSKHLLDCPLVNFHITMERSTMLLMGKSTINDHFPQQTVCLPEADGLALPAQSISPSRSHKSSLKPFPTNRPTIYTHIRSFSRLGRVHTCLPKQLAWIRHKKAKWNLAEIPSSICNSGFFLVNTQKAIENGHRNC